MYSLCLFYLWYQILKLAGAPSRNPCDPHLWLLQRKREHRNVNAFQATTHFPGESASKFGHISSLHVQLSVKPSRLGDLKNADLKNSYTFHATLPNQVCQLPYQIRCAREWTVWKYHIQVAWCDEGEGTKFSRFFTEGLQQNPPVYIGLLDEYINRRWD